MLQPLYANAALLLHDVTATRAIEQRVAAQLPPGTLMQRAGLAVARLALALAPHGRQFALACGPGNNGGDGLEAAAHLRSWGKDVQVVWLGNEQRMPADAHAALRRARGAGVAFVDDLPTDLTAADLCIDALLGIGASRPPRDTLAELLQRLHASAAPLLCVDVPTGLDANTGQLLGTTAPPASTPHPRHTLTLLTCKPGLFTAHGADTCGKLWFDDLGATGLHPVEPTAQLNPTPVVMPRLHASHKGSYGDVAVIGGAVDGANGIAMQGAALLAASAALHAGAGRVYVSLLDQGATTLAPQQPELMFRRPQALQLHALTIVCGCGGGTAIQPLLQDILGQAQQLVLDADGLNAVAGDPQLQQLLAGRTALGQGTVLTPHPLEAARLLQVSTARVQADRLQAARLLVEKYRCTVVLKGSGTVIAAPGQLPRVNATGNARLACAGTGDVLAGFMAALMAGGMSPFSAASAAVYTHGRLADGWPPQSALTAAALARHWPPAPQ